MKKIRVVPLLLTMVISAGVLFGGYTFVRAQWMEKPLATALSNIEHVEHAEVAWSPSELKVQLTLESPSKLAAIMEQVYKLAGKEAKSRDIQVNIMNQATNEHLEQFWSTALFSVAEAMSHQRYGDIPARLQDLMKQDPTVQVDTAMDERNIYISLTDKAGFKSIVLPLQGSRMGVWPNEEPQSEMA